MALSANTARRRRNVTQMRRGSITVKTSAVVYNGSLLVQVESTGRGKAAATSGATGETFVGIAELDPWVASVTGNTAGTVTVNYVFNHQEEITARTALTKAYVGCTVFLSDDDRVTTGTAAGTATLQNAVGEFVSQSSTSGKAWVWVRKFGSKSAP